MAVGADAYAERQFLRQAHRPEDVATLEPGRLPIGGDWFSALAADRRTAEVLGHEPPRSSCPVSAVDQTPHLFMRCCGLLDWLAQPGVLIPTTMTWELLGS